MDNAFDERAKKAVDAVSDLAKQLITLATGVIAITISFAKDVFGGGTLDPSKPASSKGSGGAFFGSNVRAPAALQVLSFIVATALVAAAAVFEARTAR